MFYTIKVFFDALIVFFSVPAVDYFLAIVGIFALVAIIYQNLMKGGMS